VARGETTAVGWITVEISANETGKDEAFFTSPICLEGRLAG